MLRFALGCFSEPRFYHVRLSTCGRYAQFVVAVLSECTSATATGVINAGVAFALTCMYSVYTITPPILSYAAIGLAFMVAGIRINDARS